MAAKQDPKSFPCEDIVYLNRGDNTSVLVHLHGATILSWRVDDVEQLFLSSTAVFDNQKAIRGGIPIVFPNFGPWEHGPQHGFARIKRWKVEAPPVKDQFGDVSATLSLRDDECTRMMWDHRFKLLYTIVLSKKDVRITLLVHNMAKNRVCDTDRSFDFTTLLHTYLRVANIETTTVLGLDSLNYDDKVSGETDVKETDVMKTIDKNVDRVYKNAPNTIVITSGPEPCRKIQIKSSNFPDVVLWNPWVEKAKEMGDFDDEGYKEMVCVEVGKVATPATIAPGRQYEYVQTLKSLM